MRRLSAFLFMILLLALIPPPVVLEPMIAWR